MSKVLDKNIGGRHQILTIKYKKRLVNGRKVCTICDEIRKMDEYYRKQSYCKYCSSDMNKKRYIKNKYKLW